MKKIILIIALIIFGSTYGQGKLPKDFIPEITLDMLDPAIELGGTSNPNVVAVTTEAALYDSENAGKVLEIQSDITLTANRTLPSNATLKAGGGVITLSTFTLTGTNTGLIIDGDNIFIDCITGNLAGTWNPPTILYATNFGAVNDGYDSGSKFPVDKSGSSNINVASTPTILTDANANFTGRTGDKIVVLNGGNDTSYSHALVTTIASVTNSTTIVLADAASNVGADFWTVSNGLDDLTVSGVYTGTRNITYKVEIDGIGTPNTFRWSKDDGATWEATGVAITGSPQLLDEGISITFAATTGHDGTGTVDTWFVHGFDMTKTRAFTGTDNYNAIYQALRNVRNKKAGKLIFPQGHFMTSTIKKVVLTSAQQDGFLVGDGVNNIIIEGNDTTLQTFPFNFIDGDPANEKRSDFFTFYKTVDSEMRYLTLMGSHYSSIDISEYPSGVNFGAGAVNPTLRNVKILEFEGDGIVANGDPQLENGIEGTNQISAAFDTGLTVGRLLPDGTIDTGQTNYIYSTDPVLISAGNFDDFKNVAGYGQFSVTGASFAGWSGLTYDSYDATIYDADDNFVAFLSDLRTYQHIRIQQGNWKKIRVCFKDVADKEDVALRVRSDMNSIGISLYDVELAYNGRQGLSNGTSDFTYIGGLVHNNGGRSPGYGLDFEDHRDATRNVRIQYVTFFDNDAGDLAFIGTENVILDNLIFKQNSRPNWATGKVALYGTYARELILSNSIVEGKTISGARATVFRNLAFDGGRIDISGKGCEVTDITGKNYQVYVDGANSDGHNKDGVNSIIRNVTIRVDSPFAFLLHDPNILGQWENIKIFLNDVSRVSNLVENTDLDASLKSGQDLWSLSNPTSGQPYGGGHIDGFTLSGNMVNENLSAYSSYARFPKFEWTRNITVDCGITLGYYGLNATSLKWEGLKCKFLDIDPRSGGYGTSVPADPVANPAPIWEFINSEIYNKATDYNMSDVNFKQIQVEDFWVDVIFKNTKFVNEFVYAQTLNRSVFFEADNYGSVTFDSCTIGNKGSEGGTVGNDIVMTNTWFRDAARTYPLIFKNTELLYSTAIIPRSVDLIRYTYPSQHAPLYVDNATAVAALGVGYWYRDSDASNELKVTF